MNLQITISCDDICPLKGYRVLGEKPEKWFRELNERFGAKITCFIPSNFHNQAPLSQNKSWVNELNSVDYLELAFHGHLHDTPDRMKYGECEFGFLRDEVEIVQRLHNMAWEWDQCGIFPVGFRTPGWVMSEESKRCIERFSYNNKKIEYVAVHYEHNRGMNWNCKTFLGHDGIQQENISIHNVSEDGQTGMIMFQSHIFGNHNHNVWNEANFEQLKISLEHLTENYSYSFKTLAECLNN